jgi:hypothetical protein
MGVLPEGAARMGRADMGDEGDPQLNDSRRLAFCGPTDFSPESRKGGKEDVNDMRLF